MSDFYDITHDGPCLCGFPCRLYGDAALRRQFPELTRLLAIERYDIQRDFEVPRV